MQVALVALATNPSFHKVLLSIVKCWPTTLYSALPVIAAIEPQMNTSSMTDLLKEVLVKFFLCCFLSHLLVAYPFWPTHLATGTGGIIHY